MDLRDYDPAIGRWTGIDPVTHFEQSPYCGMDNNPVSFADPSGADAANPGWTITIDMNQVTNNAATVIQPFEAGTDYITDPKLALEMAIISADVYGSNEYSANLSAIGWSHSNYNPGGVQYVDAKIGFKSGLYERLGSKEYVYATAGTDFKEWKDWENNISQTVGISAQYDLSVSNAIKLKNSKVGNNLSFTGHSLGGGMAEANAIATGLKAITFNAAALSGATKSKYGSGISRTNAYIMTTDPLNALQMSTGNSAGGSPHYLPAVGFGSYFNGHSINSVISSLRSINYLMNLFD